MTRSDRQFWWQQLQRLSQRIEAFERGELKLGHGAENALFDAWYVVRHMLRSGG